MVSDLSIAVSGEQLFIGLAIGTGMASATVLVHFGGLLLLTWIMNRQGYRLQPHLSHLRRAAVILVVVLGIFALHSIEIWLYAALYLALGEMAHFEEALYFSTAAFATIGFGDVVMSPRWRIISVIEGANGWILFAWSTAFLIGVTTRMRVLEHDWLDRRG